MKFKVGDKVKIKDSDKFFNIGKEATVVCTDGGFIYEVTCELKNGMLEGFQECNLELIKEKYELNFLEKSIIKLISNHKRENGRDDIKKAIEYLDIILENYDEIID